MSSLVKLSVVILAISKRSASWHALENQLKLKARSLPAVYRQCAVFYSDFWVSYPLAFPSSRHRAVGKETGLTSYIERFNGTLRQRVSRLVRKSLSFSKKLENHISAIWYFIHHYNASLPVHLSFPF